MFDEESEDSDIFVLVSASGPEYRVTNDENTKLVFVDVFIHNQLKIDSVKRRNVYHFHIPTSNHYHHHDIIVIT